MAVPSFVNNGAVTTTGSGTSLTPALPSGRVNNQLLVAIICVQTTGKTFSVGGGWTVDETVNTTNHSVARISRLVDGTEAAPVISWTGNAQGQAWIVQVKDNATTSYFGNSATAQGNSGTAITAGTITTTADNSLIGRIIVEQGSVVILETVGSASYTKNAGFTNTGCSHSFFSGTVFVSGNTAAAMVFDTASGNWDSISFEIIGTGSAPAGEPAQRSTGVVQQVLLDSSAAVNQRATGVVQQVLLDANVTTNVRATGVVLQVLRTVSNAPATDVRNKAMLLLRCGG